MDWMFTSEIWVALLTLATLEIVLGVDNLVFISIAVSRLPPERRPAARRFGLALACVTRILLLLSLAFLARMQRDLFSLFGQNFSIRDLVLIGGGLFLLVKGTMEIHDAVEGRGEDEDIDTTPSAVFGYVIAQIAVIDIVFSLDSVITAVGMVDNIGGDGGGDHDRGGGDDVRLEPDRRLHRPPSDDQDAGAGLHHPGRRGADRRRLRDPHRAQAACTSPWPSRPASRR